MAGRKSKYESHVESRLFEIEHWARDGLIEEEICKRLGVGVSTFNEYKLKYLELTEALKKGREISDYEVEDALFKKATGYEFEEKTYLTYKMDSEELEDFIGSQLILFNISNPEASQDERWAFIDSLPKEKRVLTKVVTKNVSPDATAAIFWLKNRKPHAWKDKQTIQHAGAVDVNNPMKQLSVEELRKLATMQVDEDG